MTKQIRHIRRSKKGKKFKAGRGNTKRVKKKSGYNDRAKLLMEDFGFNRKEAENYMNVVEGRPRKVRKNILQHGDITIFQPGLVPADRRIKKGPRKSKLPDDIEKMNREAEKRLKKLMGY